MVAWTFTASETSSSDDNISANYGETIGPETSTSTDLVRVEQGRRPVETSISDDNILTQVQSSSRILSEVSYSYDQAIAEYDRPDIADYEFVIVDPVTNSLNPWVPFGGAQEISGTFEPGGFEVVDQDSNAVIGDYRMFGTDRHSPPTWNFHLFTQSDNATDALAWVDLLKRVWNNPLRNLPEQVLALRYQIDGRQRRVHGRPRRFTPVPKQVQRGKVYVECDFDLSEDIYYGDDESTATSGLSPAFPSIASGIILPQPLPWHFTTQAPPRTGQMVVDGTEKTWVDIDIYGPCASPWVKIGNLTWGLNGTLQVGQKVTISGKPWSMGVRRNDGTNVPGWLDPRSRLSALQIYPGTYSFQYGALFDNTSSSYAVARWRPAYQSL